MLKEDIVRIHRYLKAHPQISLVVLDPLTSYLGEVDYNKDKEIRPVMDALSALCEKTKVTFVAVMHLNKRSDVGAIHKILGASSVAGSARVAWGFSPDPEDRELKHMSLIKNNISKQRSGLDYKIVTVEVDVNGEIVGHGAVEWQGVNEMNADDQMQHTKEVRGQKKRIASSTRRWTSCGASWPRSRNGRSAATAGSTSWQKQKVSTTKPSSVRENG